MKFFNVTLTWIGVEWEAPATQIRIEMLRADDRKAARAKVAQMFVQDSWQITDMVEL